MEKLRIRRPSWDEYFLGIAYAVARRSECLDKHVGCVITDERNRLIGTGYNGFPPGMLNVCDKECLKDLGGTCPMIHAELNAMLYTDMSRAHTMYVTLPPCETCTRHINSTTIERVVVPIQFKGDPKLIAPKNAALEFVDPTACFSLVGQVPLQLTAMFDSIKRYHSELGFPKFVMGQHHLADCMGEFRDIAVALNQEVAELVDSLPWKPWRDAADQNTDLPNFLIEMVDIFFFLGSLLEITGIAPQQLEEAFYAKMAENYDRIHRGYNNTLPKEDEQ